MTDNESDVECCVCGYIDVATKMIMYHGKIYCQYCDSVTTDHQYLRPLTPEELAMVINTRSAGETVEHPFHSQNGHEEWTIHVRLHIGCGLPDNFDWWNWAGGIILWKTGDLEEYFRHTIPAPG